MSGSVLVLCIINEHCSLEHYFKQQFLFFSFHFICLNQDLIIHVTDSSHPEYELQKNTVEDVLERLELSNSLKENMLLVLNKTDLRYLLFSNNLISFPVSTRRRFDVVKTSFERQQRCYDVETTSCAYWVVFSICSYTINPLCW